MNSSERPSSEPLEVRLSVGLTNELVIGSPKSELVSEDRFVYMLDPTQSPSESADNLERAIDKAIDEGKIPNADRNKLVRDAREARLNFRPTDGNKFELTIQDVLRKRRFEILLRYPIDPTQAVNQTLDGLGRAIDGVAEEGKIPIGDKRKLIAQARDKIIRLVTCLRGI